MKGGRGYFSLKKAGRGRKGGGYSCPPEEFQFKVNNLDIGIAYFFFLRLDS